MRYKVKEVKYLINAGKVGIWLGSNQKQTFLQFRGEDVEGGMDIRGYLHDEVEPYNEPKKSESQKRKEDAYKTLEMIEIEMSKHHSIKEEVDTLLKRLHLEVTFIKVGESDV